MRMSELTQLIEDDSKIDDTKLDLESLKIPYLHAKYYKIFIEELRVLKGIEAQYGKIRKDRIDYYTGKSDDDVYKEFPLDHRILKADLDIYLNADTILCDIESKKSLQDAKVKMVESFIKTLTNRSFTIKNAIEFRKFQVGSI